MAKGYKIRLADGSEIGPMDREAVRSWYAQGLATRETPVLAPGAKRWVSLAEAVELKDLRAPAPRPPAAAPPTSAGGSMAPRPRNLPGAADGELWRLRLAAGLFASGALGALFFVLFPERWLRALHQTPWLPLSLVLLIFAALLLRGREWARQLVRVSVFAAGLAGFAVLGLLVAQGVRGLPLLVVVSAMVSAGGFFGLLAGGPLSRQRLGLALASLLAGVAGVVGFGVIARNPLAEDILKWSSDQKRFSDEALGVSFELPSAWRVLRPEQTLVETPAETQLCFGNPELAGVGFLVAESAPKGVVSLDHYLERFLQQRRAAHPSLAETARSELSLSGVPGRKLLSSWEDDTRYVELIAVSRDGWTYVALAAWMPASDSFSVQRELESLLRRLSLSGVLAGQLQEAVGAATREVPYLSASAAEMVMSQSAALTLDPEVAFRRAYRLASSGLNSLDGPEVRELGDLTSLAYETLPRGQRLRLAAYFDRVRADEATSAEEDREMQRLMKAAVLKLPPPRLARLQELYEKAVRVAILQE